MATRSRQRTSSSDKQSLGELANSYIDALLAQNPAQLPLAANLRFTENRQALRLGQALWKTVTGATDYRVHVTDSRTG
jgi:hypothetical protein